MNRNLLCFYLISTVIIVGWQCKSHEKIIRPEPEIQNVIIDKIFIAERDKRLFKINSTVITGDLLTINVTYKGGCGSRTFKLFSNGIHKKSLPMQIDVFLTMTLLHETCDKDITENLRFNIKQLRFPVKGKLVVNVNGITNRAEYNY